MFGATSVDKSRDVPVEIQGKNITTRPGSQVRKKTPSPEVTLPPLSKEPRSSSSSIAARPLLSHSTIQSVRTDRSLSVVELPRLISQVQSDIGKGTTRWREGPRLMAAALETCIPMRTAAQSTAQSFTEKHESTKVTLCKEGKITTAKDGKVPKTKNLPRTLTEVLQIFVQKKNSTDLKLYYLKEVDEYFYRPYDLKVVPSSDAGSEHYVFSPNYVFHVTERGYGGLISLAEWYRESVLWAALQKIPFFRSFRRQKAFNWWHRNVRKISFQRRCEDLQDMLFIAAPQFRRALRLLIRVIEDLKQTHYLPLEVTKSYTLLEFKNTMTTKRQEFLKTLEKLSQYRTVILNTVKENSYRAHKELQLHIDFTKKPNKCYEPIYLHLTHQQRLKTELAQSKCTLQKLGNFGSLVDHMIVQSLITIIKEDVAYFLNNVLKRKKSQGCCLFNTELCFGAKSELTVDPPIHLFKEAIGETLLTVGDTIIQMCDTSGFFQDISNNVISSDFAHDLTSDPYENRMLTEDIKNNGGITCKRKICCWQLLMDESYHWLTRPRQSLLTVQGNMVRGCFYPLSKTQLEWHISINDITKHVKKELARSTQDAELQSQQLCESHTWLVDLYLFVSQWSRASLESMKGQPASLYEEHIKKVHVWAERMDTVPSSLSISDQVFVINCTNIKETLEQRLRVIESEVLDQLVEQITLQSENLVSDLERASAELKMEPEDLQSLSKYALVVRESVKLMAVGQKQLEYILSLQNIVCTNYRKMTEQELKLKGKMQGLWDCFIALLKHADNVVCQRLPSMANALDTMFSFLVCDLKSTVSKGTSGPFIDPNQNAEEMVTQLKPICLQVHHLIAKLEELVRNSQTLQEHAMDLTVYTTEIQMIKARKELWELIAMYKTWIEEWKDMLFIEVVVSQAQKKVAEWKQQALSLTSIILPHDPVLQKTSGMLESISHQLAVMAMLQSPALRHKHWRAIFEGMGLLYVPEKKVTVAELMSQQLVVHQKLITKVCNDARAECDMEQKFQKLRQGWESRLFWLDKFSLPAWQHSELQYGLTDKQKQAEGIVSHLQNISQHSSKEQERLIIIGLEIYCADVEHDLMTLYTMSKSPYSVEFRPQMEDWVQSLQDIERLLDLFGKYQQVWAFLMKIFSQTSFSVQRVDLLEQFQTVDETFKEIMYTVSTDPHVVNFVNSKKTNDKFHGNSLCHILTHGLSKMEAINNQVVDLLDALREQFPRLWFLSDREVIQMVAYHPTPLTLEPFVRKCFIGIHRLEVDNEIQSNKKGVKRCGATSKNNRQMKVLGFFGNFNEHIIFMSPLKPHPNALVWLSVFENQLGLTMVQRMQKCAAARHQLELSISDLTCDNKSEVIMGHLTANSKNAQPVLDLLSEYPLQCVLVAEEVLWCNVLLQASQESSSGKLSNLRLYNSVKLNNLGRDIRESIRETKGGTLVSKYIMMCLRALVQLTMNHAEQLSRLMEVQCVLESSFEFLSLMKYHLMSEDQGVKASEVSPLYVDVLGHHFQYGYEYFSPDDRAVLTPSTDRAILGILLALKSYRCGFIRGPCMSGKKKTVVHVGKALGRQMVIVQCCQSITPSIVQKMLLGALHTGALLLLDSVDLLTQGILSSLAQHVSDIHQSFSDLISVKQRLNDEPKDRATDGVMCSANSTDPEYPMVFAGKQISANPNYGCVLTSSKMHATEIPESLRFATRPIALTHPDYRIIAEVMLTSFGFSEAMSLSRRLVSLIGLAKESLCLTDLVSDDQCCYLVILKKIISASEIHLHRSVREQEFLDQFKGMVTEQTDLKSSQDFSTTRVVEKDRKETEKTFRLHRSHLSVVQGLMEETAIVKAVLSVLLPSICERKKALQFYNIFKDAFPIACQFPLFQQYIEEQEKNQLKHAITEELKTKRLHPDNEMIFSALTLYQTMKFSQTVLLIGPSGSGKTTCYCALAGALNSLAAKTVEYVFEYDGRIKEDAPQAEPHSSASSWNNVDPMVIFPNAMSHEEVFGYLCEKSGWRDGAVTRVLKNSERREHTLSRLWENYIKTPMVKWLVMDGEPVGRPGWLDYLITLCDLEEPFLFLSSGETLVPSQTYLKLLMEVTDLSEASPSTVTRCSLVHFTGTDLWKAVWKSEMDTLCCEHRIDQGTLKMWNRLAEDLFSSTLSLLRQKTLTPALYSKGKSSKSHRNGLQEIMSFVRILHALLQHFGKREGKAEPVPQIQNRGTDEQGKQELFVRSLFLVAYIWGFGGHLHPCHWPQFDLIVRQVLFTSRYAIAIPDKETVFEHFFSINGEVCPKNTLLTTSIIPKHRQYAYLLNLMLDANQPVLLAGEPGSGKSTLCQAMLTFDKLYISLPASPLLSSKDLRNVLKHFNYPHYCKDAATKQQRLLLFVDDLHEACCDVFGKTPMALESLRESMSKGEILTFDTYCFKLLSSKTMNYMATCCVSGLDSHQSNVISPRLSRLFSIFVLPSLSIDVILSIQSPRLQVWLKETLLNQNGEDMACCIVTATTNLYHAVSNQFRPRQRPHFMFSQRDLHKVFRGMCLWQPNTSTTGIKGHNNALPGSTVSVLNIVHLWLHECMRTFSDRLCSEDETRTLVSLIAKAATTHYGIRVFYEARPDHADVLPIDTSPAVPTLSIETAGISKELGQSEDTVSPPQMPKPAGQSDSKKDNTLTELSFLSKSDWSEETRQKIHQHMEDIIPQLVYGPDLSEAFILIDRQHNFKCASSYKVQNLDTLLKKLSALMDRKEEGNDPVNNYNITHKYLINKQVVSQLVHILRALLIPGGHGVLFGSDKGTGRKTTVRLAAYLTGYQITEIHSGNEEKLHEILKEAGNQTKVDGCNAIILVHEEVNQSFREELLVAMAHRTYPALKTEEELKNYISRVTNVNNSRKYLMDTWTFEKYLSQVHRNVHVFLLMSSTMLDISETPANLETHSWKGQMAKALTLSCCVEVYQPWSKQSLVEAAAQCLRSINQKMKREGSESSLPVAMAGIHQSACQYASILLKAQPFSPQTFMDFIACFGYLCKHLQNQQHQANRVSSVLAHLDAINIAAENYKKNLQRLQEKVAETQQRKQELHRAVDDQKNLIEEFEKKCIVMENELDQLEEQINQASMEEKTIFQAGLNILKCLNPSDFEEVRHYRDPPDGVVKIMDAICLLFNHPPGWESSKQLLGKSNFFQELEFFDRCSLTCEQLQQLGEIVHSPQFVPESVREVSKACESLCRWVQALYEYCCMQSQLSVKRELETLALKVQGQLHLTRQQKKNAYYDLQDIEPRLHVVQNDLEVQLVELRKYESMNKEATAIAQEVEIQIRNWKAAAQEIVRHNENLAGDALTLAAVIAYLGPFPPDIRTELLSKWRELCQRGSININPQDLRTSLFSHSDPATPHPPRGFPISVSERLQQPLGQALGLNEWQLQDTVSARLLVQLLLWGYRNIWVQRWPLLADTQQHLERGFQSWPVTGENAKLEMEWEMVVSASDPELLEKLDQAAVQGLRVLVTHVEHLVPSTQFLERLVRPLQKQHVQSAHPKFCLFLSTCLPARMLSSDIHPSILAQVHVVDLSLSSEEIQELMLTQLPQPECKKLLNQHLQLQNEKQLLQEKLFKEKDALMDFILQSNTSLLQDSDFLPCMAVRQESMEKLRTEIHQLCKELEYHRVLVAAPRKLPRLAAALYQALQELSRLSPTYYFSLHSFISVMQDAFTVKGKPIIPHTFGNTLGDPVPEITNRMVAQLLVHYRPCLFKSHFAVLKLLVSLTLLQYNELCSEGERLAFLRGLQDPDHPGSNVESHPPSQSASESTSSLPNWIPPHIHPDLLCLEKIPSFKGLIASLCTSPIQWQEYLHFPSSTATEVVPCRSHSHLSLLQRALLWKTIIPNGLEGLAEAITTCLLCLPGQTAGSQVPNSGNPEALSNYLVKHKGPIILSFPSQRGDSWTSVQPYYLITKLAHCVQQSKKMQIRVISFGALYDRESMLSALDKAVNHGHWLVFNDCHLLDQWDDKVVAHLSQLIASVKDEQHLVHPDFRLWFITQENISHCIPGELRIWALPLVCDSPLDLKEELSCSLRQVASTIQCQSQLDVTADNTELLSCAIFHSVLLQRQTYKYLGQGRIYHWSQEDLLALVDAYISIARLCDNKTTALHYIAVSLLHGGHVLDSEDLEVVESVAKTFISRVSPLWCSGPKTLLNIVSNYSHFDLSELLRIVDQSLQDSANSSDPVMLGFSADVADEIIKINSHNLNLLLQASQTPLGTSRSVYPQLMKPSILPTYSHARDRLRALKSYIAAANLASTVKNAEAVPQSPLRDFLQDEWEDLIDLVSSLFSQLQEPFQCSALTFASLLKLTDLSRLERRAELLSAYLWHHNTPDPPGAYRLSAFKNARGFLVAVIREAAKINYKQISDIELHFQVQSNSTCPASHPMDTVYLCGLELRGSSWDTQLEALRDTGGHCGTRTHSCLMPLVCVKAQVRIKKTAQVAFPCQSTFLTNIHNIQVSDASPSAAFELPVYHCPLYFDEEQETGDWGLADVNMITKVPLHAELNPVLCSLRRVRLVSIL
ncbi:dynein heavy chain domain-containing protein 1-like isoform X2 [Channa argus]|uniref:dynein heavy chain domain-containing protein 1-like isoform X2 n=1 Tax=Channa argus TaxID=215402 RepID=UPI00352066B3